MGMSHPSGRSPALLRLLANDPAALVVRRTPFANVFDMPKTAQAHLLLIEPAGAHAR